MAGVVASFFVGKVTIAQLINPAGVVVAATVVVAPRDVFPVMARVMNGITTAKDGRLLAAIPAKEPALNRQFSELSLWRWSLHG